MFTVLRLFFWEAGGRGLGRCRIRYVEAEWEVVCTVRGWVAKERCLRRDTDHAMRLTCRFRRDEIRDCVSLCFMCV